MTQTGHQLFFTLNFKIFYNIYYEDTDSGGVVYYSNYLNFLERARTEMINSLGLSNIKLLNEHFSANV